MCKGQRWSFSLPTNTIITPHAHYHMHTITCTPPHVHHHMHTITCTPLHAHHHMHTSTGTPSQAHHHMHTSTCTPSHAHQHMHTITGTPPYGMLACINSFFNIHGVVSCIYLEAILSPSTANTMKCLINITQTLSSGAWVYAQ